jgi:hypothetical protein
LVRNLSLNRSGGTWVLGFYADVRYREKIEDK